jgi:ribosomal protein L17
VTNGGQEKTVASIVDHVPQLVTDAQDQVLMNVRTVLKTHTTRLMDLVTVVTSGWELTVHTNVLIVMRPVKSALLQTLTSVSSAKMDSHLLTDTVSHVLTAVKHAQQPMEPLPTNVKAATQASVSMAMNVQTMPPILQDLFQQLGSRYLYIMP